jgi:hypothetical protein
MWTHQVATDNGARSPWRRPAADVECDIQLLGYDSSVERVWLVHDPGWCLDRLGDRSASTYELDLHSGSWQRLAVATPGFRVFDWGPPRMDIAYDEANGLSVVYDGLRLTAYDAVARRWDVVYTRPAINTRDGGLTHFRVPRIRPDNRRVMVGGDPLARSGGYYENWVTFGDITSIDLATRTWTELLAGIRLASPSAAPSPTPIVEVSVDAAGDASPARAIDIVLVTTSVADGMLTLEVTLAQDWPTGIDGSDSPMLFVEWVADDRPHAGSGFSAGCGAWVATYRSSIAPDGTVSGSLPLPAGQVADVSGPVLTLTVPLEAFENPTTLGFALSTASQGGDRFPDDARESLCHDIPLTPPD